MTLEELKKLVNQDLPSLEGNPNTFEYASKAKEAAKAAYALNFFPERNNIPELYNLESSWKLLVPVPQYRELEMDRDAIYESPLSMFMSLVRSGYYPPPEIMFSLLQCFDLYMEHAGKKSLDEVFFGQPHKNKSSKSFESHQFSKYIVFGIHFHAKKRMPGTGLNLKGKSMVERAELYLNWIDPNDTKTDPESFLKGYRRWRKTVEK